MQNRLKRPREIQNNRKNKKEDGILVSQKILLTWLIESEDIFRQIEKYITPEDFFGRAFPVKWQNFCMNNMKSMRLIRLRS